MSPQTASFAFADLWGITWQTVPDRTALVAPGVRRSFAEVDERANRLASWMEAKGIVPGAFVGVQMRNRPEHVETLLALYKLRAVPVNLNYRLGPSELAYLYEDADLVGIIHDSDQTPLVDRAASALVHRPWTLPVGDLFESALLSTPPAQAKQRSDDDLFVLYTGGTTGRPKAVEWRMRDAFFACLGGGDPSGQRGPIATPEELADRMMPQVVFLPAPPLVHAAGLWSTLRWLLAGARVVMLEQFDPHTVWQTVRTENVTVMNIVGDAMARPLLVELAKDPDKNLIRLETLTSGGLGLGRRSREAFLNLLPGLTIKDSYGSSETGVHGMAVHRKGESLDGLQMRDTVLVDPSTLRALPPTAGTRGLITRIGHVPIRYRGDDALSARTFVASDAGAMAISGDWGEFSDSGRLTLLGRGSQCINSGGEKVFPEEVEQALATFPGVSGAVVVGLPDPTWGERVVALVSVEPDAIDVHPTAMRQHCRSTIAKFKVPKDIAVVPTVRRTVAGKPDYRWAREVADQCFGTTPAVKEAP